MGRATTGAMDITTILHTAMGPTITLIMAEVTHAYTTTAVMGRCLIQIATTGPNCNVDLCLLICMLIRTNLGLTLITTIGPNIRSMERQAKTIGSNSWSQEMWQLNETNISNIYLP